MVLETIDIIIVALYGIALFGIAFFISREKEGHEKSTEDYFLAGKALPWWAIGASLIAANISAEQIIGQSGQGFAVGLAIAAYEWQAAIVLLVVAKFFLPIFLKRGIYTMPQFLSQRYGEGVKVLMSIYWIFLYVAVNLTAVLWLGGLAIESLTGIDVLYAMIGLGVFAVVYSLYGGLKAVAMTDIIQVVILIFGGFAITWISLGLVGGDGGAIEGFKRLTAEMPGHFEMILSKDHPSYQNLPGIWTLLGGLWVLHFSYWGFNQYIIQRALGAKDLAEAQKGLALAAFLKLLMPLIIVIPGIAALMLASGEFGNVIDMARLDPELGGKTDRAYGELMRLMPAGLKGLVFAALIAAIVSSLASMMNSISTIFTMDIYKDYVKDKAESHYVKIGRITALISMVIALVLAKPFLGGLESAFQTLQEYTGYIAPGVVAIFLFGMFWKRMNTPGAFAVLIGSVIFNYALGEHIMPETAFVIRIWLVFLICIAAGVVVSLITPPPAEDRPVDVAGIKFNTKASFNIMSVLVTLILIALYVVYW